jgi:hypothetical protein
MMTSMKVRFGDCELIVERLELRRADKIVGIEPQVCDVLSYLLRHRDRIVPKTELLDEIWGDRFVSDSTLSSRIKSAATPSATPAETRESSRPSMVAATGSLPSWRRNPGRGR